MQDLRQQEPFQKGFKYLLRSGAHNYLVTDLIVTLASHMDSWIDEPSNHFRILLGVRIGERGPDAEV